MRDAPDEVIVAWLDAQPPSSIWTTAITVLECRFGIARLPAGRRKDGLDLSFTRLLSDDLAGRILAFGAADAEQTASLMARRQAEGQSGDLRDSMIAGIVLSRRAWLATRNTRHFADANIDVIDPWNP